MTNAKGNLEHQYPTRSSAAATRSAFSRTAIKSQQDLLTDIVGKVTLLSRISRRAAPR
jgi:hypothetical protein